MSLTIEHLKQDNSDMPNPIRLIRKFSIGEIYFLIRRSQKILAKDLKTESILKNESFHWRRSREMMKIFCSKDKVPEVIG